MNCSQCHGCAYKAGAAANTEGDNFLRGLFAALGGYVFVCHDSMGWKPEKKGYPEGTQQALAILTSRHFIIKAGASPALIEEQVAEIRKSLRVCGGWKAAVARLKSIGWFSHPGVTSYRRMQAKHAAACLERLTKHPDMFMPDDQRSAKLDTEDIEEAIRWFFNEAKEAGVKIGWLFEGVGRLRGSKHEP